ncbi:F-box only protein 30-like isoform X2 [Oratosquilla oratoria]
MEAPVSSYSEEDEESDESLNYCAADFEDEVDINIHFHCEHCIKLYKCQERPKPGWSCEIMNCDNGCGLRFHTCKLEEHLMLCTHARVPCINAGNGCPHFIHRWEMGEHLSVCPASVIICNAEWNRWALGAKEREKVTLGRQMTALYEPTHLDVALALRDQELVNEMHKLSREARAILCNGITRRYPPLPYTLRGSHPHSYACSRSTSRAQSQSTTDEEEDALTPGLSTSVCTKLLKKSPVSSQPEQPNNGLKELGADDYDVAGEKKKMEEKRQQRNRNIDDITALCCTHGIMKDLCHFCRYDPDEPDFKVAKVWRETLSVKDPENMKWVQEPRVEKIRKRGPLGMIMYAKVEDSDEEDVEESDKKNLIIDETGRVIGKRARFRTPPPAALTPGALTVELGLKHYSRHQTKPRPMFTFQCMQEMRRDEFSYHYQNVHSEIQESLDGWLLHRCPLQCYGCPYAHMRLHPGKKDSDVVYCHTLQAFGAKPILNYQPELKGEWRSRSPSVDRTLHGLGSLRLQPIKASMRSIPEEQAEKDMQYFASSAHITLLPIETLQHIARFLDGFSLNNLSLTCHLLRDVCMSLLDERGLVIQEWVRCVENNKIRWQQGRKRWFFSKCFEQVGQWGFKDTKHMGDHLAKCPFNIRVLAKEKFAYAGLGKGGLGKEELCRKLKTLT